MRTCVVVLSSSTALKCLSKADVDNLNCCCAVLRTKSALKLEFGSHWNYGGNGMREVYVFTADGLRRVIGERVCSYQSERRSSAHTTEKPLSDLRASLSSCLRGWLSQIFSVGIPLSSNDGRMKNSGRPNSGSGADSCGLLSPLSIGFDSTNCDALATYPVQLLEHTTGLPMSSDYLQEQNLIGNSLAAASIADFISSLPSIGDFQNASHPCELGLNRVLDAHKFSNSLAQLGGVLSAPSSTVEIKGRACDRSSLCVTPDELGSPEALALWLSDRLPLGISQLKLWGTAPGTKRVTNLWIELMEGEILLEDSNPPKRTVHVASVKIKNEAGQLLVEAHQEMADGTIRLRNRPLSEKMRPGENVEDACFRGIFEELGCQLGAKSRVKILPDSYRRQEEERESLSYPGLLTSYVIHSIEATVDNLPDIEFYTVENEISGVSWTNTTGYTGPSVARDSKASCFAGGVKKHFWRWVSQAS